MSKYNPNKVITEANEKLTSGDYNGGQFLFQSALLQWTDDAREDHTIDNQEAIATLWLAYTQYLIQGNQFKSATDAFEEAMDSCPQSGRIFAEAARYAAERNKRTTAQNIYIRALRTIVDEQDQDLLWNDLLEMKREEEPNLTMKELKEAIQNAVEDDEPDQPSSKRPKLLQDNKTHVVTKDEVDKIAETIDLDEMPEDIMLAWLSFDGSGAPQRPDKTLFSPSPPKLSDPTAKDILGIELAIQLSERLLQASGTLVLETCRGLWTLQALKEKECQILLQNVETKLLAEHEQLESDLEARLAVAGAAADAVRRMNDDDRKKFQQTANETRQEVLKRNAWEIRKILCSQQQILSLLQVPGFTPVGPSIDKSTIDLQQRVAKFLHTSFFIRSKTGAEKHSAMLRAQLEKLKQYSPSLENGTAPPVIIERLSPLPPSAYGQQQQHQQRPQPQQHQQHQHNDFGYDNNINLPPMHQPPPPYYGGGGMMMMMMPPQGMMASQQQQQIPPLQMMSLPPPPPNQPLPNQFGHGYYH